MSPTTTLTTNDVSTQEWPTKAEAALVLGVSTKTVEKYVQDGKLTQRMRSRINKPPCVVIDPDSITKLMETKISEGGRELAEKPSQIASQNTSQSLITDLLRSALGGIKEGISEGFANHSWPLPLYLSIGGAVRYTGLAADHIQKAAKESKVTKVGRKYRRADLDLL